jgi:hypothetical protein
MSLLLMTAVMKMRVSLKDVGGTNVLAQAVSGRNVLRKLLAATEREPFAPEPVFLDFAGVDVATSSFLRESVVAYRDAMRARRSNLYPVVSNPNEAVEEELDDTLRSRGDAMLACALAQNGPPAGVRLLGGLDPKHRQTFELVRKLGETDAATLLRDHGEEKGVTRTAWNNRLATLAGLGLVVEVSQGRAKRYVPVLQGA